MSGCILEADHGLTQRAMRDALIQAIPVPRPRRALLIPPDITRLHSYAGTLTAWLYDELSPDCVCDVLPALGTHMPMTRAEQIAFFGKDIPASRFLTHRWREDVVKIGEVPAAFVSSVSEGLLDRPIDVEINRCLSSGDYDWIVSLGQVVPHEVVGMANYSKNLFVGCGGSNMINASHMLGAFYGIERILGQDHTPVRQVFDYAEQHFLSMLPLTYVLTVTTLQQENVCVNGLYIGRERSYFERAVALSQQRNITHVPRPFKTCVVSLDPREFRTTWLGNKSIYRTRLAMADGGHLIVLAPGLQRFGEDEENDRLIRLYGYCGREAVLRQTAQSAALRANLSVAAHLIQGSTDGRFQVTYCTPPALADAIQHVGYQWAPLDVMMAKLGTLSPGYHRIDGEERYDIVNPAVGLWVYTPAGESHERGYSHV